MSEGMDHEMSPADNSPLPSSPPRLPSISNPLESFMGNFGLSDFTCGTEENAHQSLGNIHSLPVRPNTAGSCGRPVEPGTCSSKSMRRVKKSQENSFQSPLHSSENSPQSVNLYEDSKIPRQRDPYNSESYRAFQSSGMRESPRTLRWVDQSPMDESNEATVYQDHGQPPNYHDSTRDIRSKNSSWISVTVYILSVYSTVLSGIWLVVAIVQPRWGYDISSRAGLDPSTAATLVALISKTIEMSFVTVFITFIGQVLTRRSFLGGTNGMTLSEMTMRNWVIQPGSLITHGESIPGASMSVLGALSLTATFAVAFYTTASEGMISPKLKYGDWAHIEMSGRVRSSYANVQYVESDCPQIFGNQDRFAAESCMNVQASGQSYRNLMNFMAVWANMDHNRSSSGASLSQRPAGTTLLYDNTTMEATWIETHASDVAASYMEHSLIINNVTMAMPHPGIYKAATSETNGILQPDDLAGVGAYSVRAGVVSPSINAMCVNMDSKQLSPLVYTEWPRSQTRKTGVGDQLIGHAGWENEVPGPLDSDGSDNFLNLTTVDNIFRWGSKYGRRPPVFQLYPSDYNIVTNSSVYMSDSIYILGKNVASKNYTLCELKSWVSPNCSTQFDISGTTGAKMRAHCEDPNDIYSYRRSFPEDQEWAPPALDWKWLADSWRLSMDLNGGIYNNNASNARILTQLALTEPKLPQSLPSMAEMLAVYASYTLVVGSIDTPFNHSWDWEEMQLEAPGPLQTFNASLRSQQYTSGHISDWQGVFYAILALVFVINVFCLAYFVLRSGLVTDFTEPQNLFALAVNSPPSAGLKASSGAGLDKDDLAVSWRVAYAPSSNRYFFEEARRRRNVQARADFSQEHGMNANYFRATGYDSHRVQDTGYDISGSDKRWLL